MTNSITRSRQAIAGSALLAGVYVVMSATMQQAQAQGRAATVFVETVEQTEIRDTQDVIGRLVSTRRSDVATRIAGIVKSVAFRVGDKVKKGRELIKIDAVRFEIEKRANQATIAAAEAGLSVARTKLKLAQQSFNRQASLRKSTAFSRSRFDDLKQAMEQSRSEVSQAAAQLQMARVGLDRANYQLTHTVITAPFDGIVIARQAQPGQYLQAGGMVATLLDINDLEIAADVPGRIAQDLKPGTTVSARFENGMEHRLVVRTALPVQNSSTRTRLVRFTMAKAGLQPSQVAVGGTITLKVPVSAVRTVTTVPKDALLRGQGGWMVFAVVKNKAVPHPLVIGQTVGNRMEVVSGIKPGAVVVVRGNERLRPGQNVRAKPATTARPKQG